MSQHQQEWPSAYYRFNRAMERFHPLLSHAPVADRVRGTTMDSKERYTRALATWRAIDAEIDAPRQETMAKARRLADVAKDLERAHNAKARLSSLFAVLRFLAATLTRLDGGLAGAR